MARSSRPLARPALHDGAASGLQALLARSFQAYRDTHLAHFNVTGPSFPQLHALFDEQYNELWTALDEIAERIRATGQPVRDDAFSVQAVPLPREADALCRHLASLHREVARVCAEVEAAAQAAGDTPTADLAVERRQAHEKHAWMLDATAAPSALK